MESLFHKIGGAAAMSAAVELFYQKVLGDGLLRPFFEDIDLPALKAHQQEFLTFALGGPTQYTGRNLRAAHARFVAMGLNDSHFDAVVRHLGATLQELGVPQPHIAEVAKIAETVRKDVLNR